MENKFPVVPRSFGSRQGKRNVLARVSTAADGDHNILPAVHPVGHRRSALRRRQLTRANLLTGSLFVSAQHRATRMVRCCGDLRVAHDNQRFGDN